MIESSNEKINQLQNINLTQEEYFKELKDIITNNINEIKKKTKKKISILTNIIPDFIDNIANIIDEILTLQFFLKIKLIYHYEFYFRSII